jgi:hypothetical protein
MCDGGHREGVRTDAERLRRNSRTSGGPFGGWRLDPEDRFTVETDGGAGIVDPEDVDLNRRGSRYIVQIERVIVVAIRGTARTRSSNRLAGLRRSRIYEKREQTTDDRDRR